MTRAELITHLEHLVEYVKYSEDAPALREAIALLKTHEERTETHACDCISREAAIVQVDKVIWDDAVAHDVKEVLKELPSTQLEVRTQMSSADCISRQAAIDTVNAHYHDEYFNFYTVTEILKQLPSAQPDHIAELSKKVDADLISRKAAINACHNWDDGRDAYAYGDMVEERLQKLPSAQPEPISEAYAKAVMTWLVQYQIKCAELQGRYTPYEVLGWIVNDWRKDNGIDGINQ